MSDAKLVGIIPGNSKSETWLTLEFRSGHLFLTFREQEQARWAASNRKQKPPLSIKAANFPALRSAIDAAEQELVRCGFLKGREATATKSGTTEGQSHGAL